MMKLPSRFLFSWKITELVQKMAHNLARLAIFVSAAPEVLLIPELKFKF